MESKVLGMLIMLFSAAFIVYYTIWVLVTVRDCLLKL